jgi:uncharacterized membrane protein YgcG
MEPLLTTSIEPIEVAFVRSGLDAALDVAAVKAVESGALALDGKRLRATGAAHAGDRLTEALIAAAAEPRPWRAARADAKLALRDARRDLERPLVARGLLREATPLRWLTGRRTERGEAWLHAARLAFPAAQIAATDPALALAVHGPRALDGTRYHAATVAANRTSTDGGGCGASFAGDGGGGHGGCGSGACCGGGSGCGGGGCGGGG